MSYMEPIAPEVGVELKKLGGEMHNAMTALREASEKKNSETLRNVEAKFAEYENANAKFAKEYALHQKALEDAAAKATERDDELKSMTKAQLDYQKQLEKLELAIAKKGDQLAKTDNPRETPEFKAFMAHLCAQDGNDRPKGGFYAFRPELNEFKTLRTDSDVQGGFLVPQVMDNEIRKNITEMSPVRMFARVRTAMSKTLDVPRRLSIPKAVFEGEGETSPNDQSSYGTEQIILYRQTVTIPATLDMMISSAFDLEREIASDTGEGYGLSEGTAFVKGAGVKGPQGFLVDTRPQVVNTATTNVLVWQDLNNLTGQMKRGQNPWFFMNRLTLSGLQNIQSTIGVPIWQPVAGDKPATIWGYPYNADFIDLDASSAGSNAKPIVFADLRRAYEIYDLVGISVIRDDLTRKKEAITEWTFRRYLTGRVIMPEAIKILKIA